jgi:hypothetical protein
MEEKKIVEDLKKYGGIKHGEHIGAHIEPITKHVPRRQAPMAKYPHQVR